MRRIFHFLSIAVFLVSMVGCAAIDPNHVLTRRLGNEAPADGAAMDPYTRQQAFDFVWNRINEAYVDPNLNGVNWRQVGDAQRPKILSAANDDIFWKDLDTMVAELGDAHTRVLSSKQYAYDKNKQSNTVGLTLAQLGDDIIVMAVSKDSAAEKAGIVKGNKLLTIDGTPTAEWWQLQSLKARKNSTERARQKTVRRILNSGDPESPSDTLVLGLERNDGTQLQTTLTRTVLPRKDSLSAKFLPNSYGNDTLIGNDLVNRLTGGGGNDTLVGGAGYDMALFSGPRSAYSVARSGSQLSVLDSTAKDGADQLSEVERLGFADGYVAMDLGKGEAAGKTALLVGATLGLAGLTNTLALGYVISYFEATSKPTLLMGAQIIVDNGITASLAGGPGNAKFVNLIYNNVVGVAPDAATLGLLTGLLDSGQYNQASFLAAVAELPLNQDHIGLIGLATTGLLYLPFG
jgi:Ca2+-binding RTX toxin-like protein